MEPFRTLTGIAAPLLLDDINSDQLAPARFLRQLEPDYKAMFLAEWRKDPDFILNRPQFREARILVAGRNFGCGSAREAAVWAMVACGIRCVIARSFPEVYRANCLQNGVLPICLSPDNQADFEAAMVALDGRAPVTVDLERQTITVTDGNLIRCLVFQIDPGERENLLAGLDEIGATLQLTPDIEALEARTARETPWLQSARQYAKLGNNKEL